MRRTGPFLGVNIDHVVTIRQARGETFPDPVKAALVCQAAGADSIVAHLREDRRHIQDADVLRLSKSLKIKFNMEMSIDPSVLRTAHRARPDTVTFVPERRRERTTEAGIDVAGLRKTLGPICRAMAKRRIGVSMFVDADRDQVLASLDLGAEAVEIHTGKYANAKSARRKESEARAVEAAVRYAALLGLRAHVGHGLDYENTGRIARIPGISEFNIGYSIVSRALFDGLPKAVSEMKKLILKAAR